jgi:hypothetical protein
MRNASRKLCRGKSEHVLGDGQIFAVRKFDGRDKCIGQLYREQRDNSRKNLRGTSI